MFDQQREHQTLHPVPTARLAEIPFGLTFTELGVLQAAAQGYTVPETARRS